VVSLFDPGCLFANRRERLSRHPDPTADVSWVACNVPLNAPILA
jgi:hypothetical protein